MPHHHHHHSNQENHGHHHHHHAEIKDLNTAFIIGIILNTVFVIIELMIGIGSSSLALISDAGHNATDVFSLLLSMFAFKLTKAKTSSTYTYGFKRATILNSLLNAILLIIVTIGIIWEGFSRINSPVLVQGKLIAIVAFGGIFLMEYRLGCFLKTRKKILI